MAKGNLLALSLLFAVVQVHARAVSIFDGYGVPWSPYVNLSSVWLLPEEGYPVFYRYFRDRITWYEADAVCQFHHGHLVTIDSAKEFDAVRAYLKELDVANFVWTGLKRGKSSEPFLWPESKEMSEREGRWAVEVPKTEEAMCAATDPSADFRWQPLPCSGPTVAAFICQMNVPSWAQNEKGCMLTSIPSLTVTFLPDQGAVELISDCGIEGTRRISCKGQADHEEMLRKLACETPQSTEAAQSETSEVVPQSTRHRRGSEPTTPTSVMPSTTSGKITTLPSTTKQETTTVTTVTEEITTIPSIHSTQSSAQAGESTSISINENTIISSSSNSGGTEKPKEKIPTPTPPQVPKSANPTSGPGQVEVAVEIRDAGWRPAAQVKRTLSSKPIPPSLRGNSPFLEPTPPPPPSSPPQSQNQTEESLPLESHEALGEGHVPSSSLAPGLHPEMEEYKKNAQDSGEDQAEDHTDLSATTISSSDPANQPMSDDPDPPERPNRGRLLVHPQHHSFYAYFLNRVLG